MRTAGKHHPHRINQRKKKRWNDLTEKKSKKLVEHKKQKRKGPQNPPQITGVVPKEQASHKDYESRTVLKRGVGMNTDSEPRNKTRMESSFHQMEQNLPLVSYPIQTLLRHPQKKKRKTGFQHSCERFSVQPLFLLMPMGIIIDRSAHIEKKVTIVILCQ